MHRQFRILDGKLAIYFEQNQKEEECVLTIEPKFI